MAEDDGYKLITSYKQARYEYFIDDTIEAGLSLTGTEVKALRAGRASLQEAYCTFDDHSLFVRHLHIPPYEHGNRNNHEPLRPRRLLMHRRELDKWQKAVAQKGFTIVPMKLYFRNGHAKIEIGLGRGKKTHDKRATIADRDADRRLRRVVSGGSDD